MTMVGAILAILATAIGLTGWMVQAQIPDLLVEWMSSVIASRVVFLLALNVFLLIVGMLMDIFTAIMVVVPLILPLANAYGVDPYHLACIFLLNLEIGYLTPPLGMNLYISSIRFSKPVTYIYRTVLPFIGVLIVSLAIVTYLPGLSTWLPNQIRIDEAESGFVMPDISTADDGGEGLNGDLDRMEEEMLGFPAGDGGMGEADGGADAGGGVGNRSDAGDRPLHEKSDGDD
jgi:hypothetical protein